MLRVKPDWTTRNVELSHRGLTYEVQAATAHSGMINVIREFGNSRKNHVTEPFAVTLTNSLYMGTVPLVRPTFLP